MNESELRAKAMELAIAAIRDGESAKTTVERAKLFYKFLNEGK
jgi:hypothetical protein